MQFLYFLLGVVVFILVLGIIVLIHEAGHFIIAKKSGILCHEFSIGMGPLIWQTKKGETMFSIRAIPFGGYVSMAGEEVEDDILKDVKKVKVEFTDEVVTKIIINLDNPKYEALDTYELIAYDLGGTLEACDGELFITLVNQNGEENTYEVSREAMVNFTKKEEIQIAPKNRTFVNKPFWNRFFSVLAGPLMNFVLALIVFFLSGLLFGYTDTSTTKIAEVTGSALSAGMENDDIIYAINDKKIDDWNELSVVLADVAMGNGITSDGMIEVDFYDVSDNNVLKRAKVYPQIYIFSMEMVLKYDKTEPDNKVIVGDYGSVMEDTKAYKAGLRAGDEIIKVNNTLINGIDDILKFFSSLEPATAVKFTVIDNDGNVVEKNVEEKIETYSLAMLDTQDIAATKVTMGVSTSTSFNFIKLLYMPWVQTYESSIQIFKTLGLFFKKDSGIKITDLSGPVGILNLFTQLVQGDNAFQNVLYWTGLLSVNIGLINLLPLPALDGGRLAFLFYEGITKKKPTPKVENTIHNIGFMLLMALFVVIFISDIIKCF